MLQYHLMTSAQIIAQVLGFVGLSCNITSVQCKRRRWVLTFQALADIVYGAQYIFLAAWSGLAISLVSAVECGVIYYFATRPDTGHSKRGADGNLRMPLPLPPPRPPSLRRLNKSGKPPQNLRNQRRSHHPRRRQRLPSLLRRRNPRSHRAMQLLRAASPRRRQHLRIRQIRRLLSLRKSPHPPLHRA